MHADVLDLLRCPRCHDRLAVVDADDRGVRVVGCERGHRHDVARQGHLNLTGAAAPEHADTAAMVAARGRYLAAGAHDRLRDALVARAGAVVVDVGAGPGWYLAGLPDTTRCVALDLSPAAARVAARAHPRVASVVADTWAPLPVADRAADTVWCVFAPRHAAEFARILRPGGEVVVVIPGEQHLAEVRAAGLLIGQQPDKERRLMDRLAADLRPTGRHLVTDRIVMPARQVADLVAMGPSAHHRDIAVGSTPWEVTTSFVVLRFAHPR